MAHDEPDGRARPPGRQGRRPEGHEDEGWTELFPFALFAVAVIATVVAVALT